MKSNVAVNTILMIVFTLAIGGVISMLLSNTTKTTVEITNEDDLHQLCIYLSDDLDLTLADTDYTLKRCKLCEDTVCVKSYENKYFCEEGNDKLFYNCYWYRLVEKNSHVNVKPLYLTIAEDVAHGNCLENTTTPCADCSKELVFKLRENHYNASIICGRLDDEPHSWVVMNLNGKIIHIESTVGASIQEKDIGTRYIEPHPCGWGCGFEWVENINNEWKSC